jgi:hypothetical protein
VLARTKKGVVTELRGIGNEPLESVELEPEMLAALGRAGAALGPGDDAAPPACRDAVLAAEDRHFFHHPGIDPIAIVRALVTNVRAGERQQGGSTITQQLAKNAFLTPHRTIRRKAEEAVLAVLLELRTPKEEILRRYLASVYLGVDGGLPIHGFAQGAEAYFGKPLGQLGAAECALLAGIIRAPNGLSPRTRARAAMAGRNRVLARMVEDGTLDAATARRARAEALTLAPPRVRPVAALYVAAEVRRELARFLPPDVAAAPGLAVFTSIDADVQRDAERAVRKGLGTLERGRKRPEPLQAALVALDPLTGRIRALVGGRDYGSSPLDRALRARRQPGSAFKPFVYLAAIDPQRCGDARPRTVVSTLADEPLRLRAGGKLWQPANYDGTFAGALALEDAIAESRNAATVRLALDVGLAPIARAATDLGVRGPLPNVPSLALGVAETSLVDLTSAYATFANGGVRRPSGLVVGVVSPAGETLWAAPVGEERVLSPAVAYLMTHVRPRARGRRRHRRGRPARRARRSGRGEDGYDGRHPRRVVHRLDAEGRRGSVGGARLGPADRAHRCAGRAADLDGLRPCERIGPRARLPGTGRHRLAGRRPRHRCARDRRLSRPAPNALPRRHGARWPLPGPWRHDHRRRRRRGRRDPRRRAGDRSGRAPDRRLVLAALSLKSGDGYPLAPMFRRRSRSRTVLLALVLVLAGCGLFRRGPDADDGDERPRPVAIDLNTASLRKVEGLPGITPSMAKRIVEGRPYGAADELVGKNILTEREFERIRDHVTVPVAH